jgi:uncharacterized protein
MRVVIDTNVTASRYISPRGAPAEVFGLWERQVFELLISEAILAEYERVLQYDKIRSRHRMSNDQIRQVIADFRQAATLVAPAETLDVIREDPADNRFLECAVAGGAQYIISGDRHLRDLGDYRGIQILKPRAFLTLVQDHDGQF